MGTAGAHCKSQRCVLQHPERPLPEQRLRGTRQDGLLGDYGERGPPNAHHSMVSRVRAVHPSQGAPSPAAFPMLGRNAANRRQVQMCRKPLVGINHFMYDTHSLMLS